MPSFKQLCSYVLCTSELQKLSLEQCESLSTSLLTYSLYQVNFSLVHKASVWSTYHYLS